MSDFVQRCTERLMMHLGILVKPIERRQHVLSEGEAGEVGGEREGREKGIAFDVGLPGSPFVFRVQCDLSIR